MTDTLITEMHDGIEEQYRVTPIDVNPSNMIEWIRPEPLTAHDQRCMDILQPGDYEIFDEKVKNFLDETREIFVRSGVTGMLRAGDLIVAVYTANGDLANASAGTYLHCVTAMLPVKFVMHKYFANASVGVREGDIFYVNEARYGGIHNPDQMAFMPVFHEGKLIAWTAALTHNPETGALEPGGMALTAFSRHVEGMKLTPIKIGTDFTIRDDMLDMMENFTSRSPRMQAIDVRARVTACDRLRRRLVELADGKSADFLCGLLRRFIVESERATRQRISQWNDGVYSSTSFIDTIGRSNTLVRGKLKATKHDDEITFDFTGTSPDNDGPFNAFPHIVAAHAAISMYAFPFHDLPISNGALAAFSWIIPEGTVFNADPDAAISCSPLLNSLTMSLVPQVMNRMMYASPDKGQVTANASSQGCSPIIAGMNQHGVSSAEIDNGMLNTEGHGARPDMDGVHAYGFPWGHAARSPDVEDTEMDFPYMRLYFNLRKNSGGFGKFQGGAGTEAALVPMHVPNLFWSVYSKSSFIPVSLGIFGGYPQAPSLGIWVRETDLFEKMKRGDKDIPRNSEELALERTIQGDYVFEHSNRPTRMGQNGDVIVVTGGGGGGFGDVLVRDPASVARDVRERIISNWTAENVYHVKFEGSSERIDVEATEKARIAEREDRLRRGKPYSEFIEQWGTQKPAEEALEYFGSWPEGHREAPLIRM